jgi:hypothetical protein
MQEIKLLEMPDTNILLFTKEKNKEKTTSCIIKNHGIKELRVFIVEKEKFIYNRFLIFDN